jgi:hypothetical protein
MGTEHVQSGHTDACTEGTQNEEEGDGLCVKKCTLDSCLELWSIEKLVGCLKKFGALTRKMSTSHRSSTLLIDCRVKAAPAINKHLCVGLALQIHL